MALDVKFPGLQGFVSCVSASAWIDIGGRVGGACKAWTRLDWAG